MENKTKYHFLIVGAGLAGAIQAHFLSLKGYRCLVIEKNKHVGGYCYTETQNNIHVHKYGAHIFHTDRKDIWDYLNSIEEFDPFINSPIAMHEGQAYNMPFNMNTFNHLFGTATPAEAIKMIEETRIPNPSPKNLEEFALSEVGSVIYNTLIKGYTEKQWGRPCSELPVSTIRRIPIRMTFDNNYFADRYQGIPVNGYTSLITKLLSKSEVMTDTDYFSDKDRFDSLAEKVIYTGPLDKFFGYRFGRLEWRSVIFKEVTYPSTNVQGVAVVNYTDKHHKYTRSIEHRHFMRDCKSDCSVISYEYPCSDLAYPSYPINDKANNELRQKYIDCIDHSKFEFVGRLAEYKYYNMNDIIEKAYDRYRN